MTRCDLYAARVAAADNCNFPVGCLLWDVMWKLDSSKRYLLLFIISALLEYGVLEKKQELAEDFTS